ncbi:MAG: ABC transporter ATP-binding protein [Deltaproteobacteria bacterium]|nr:ABC transporter ATP-binding protein [Deltaproteobacteria bacterium]
MGDTLILQVRDLKTYFFTKRGVGKAVDGVSFDLRRGETLGLVGESGCGKSMTCLSVMRLHPGPAARILSGQVLLHGEELLQKTEKEMRKLRGKHIAMILQDPMTALNPVFTIGNQLAEPLRIHQKLRGHRLLQRAIELLRMLQIPAAESRLKSFPHQFSGGMRQRAVSSIALSCDPEVIVADEPTTSLDVTIQAAFLELLKEIQRRSNLAILFVTHDFGVVARMCDRVAVMYAGKIIETADTQRLFSTPAHPYTEALLKSVPEVNVQIDRLYTIEGQPPSIYDLPAGCPFAPRCPYVEDRCRQEFPPVKQVANSHTVSCWRHV